MPRAIWSGSIVFGLVSAPVKMYSAIAEHDLELHPVHEKDGFRIGYEQVCKEESKRVDIVKTIATWVSNASFAGAASALAGTT